MPAFPFFALLACLLLLVCRLEAGEATTPPPDPADARWEIVCQEFFALGKDKKGTTRDLILRPVIVDGVWTGALASAPRFNGALHTVTVQRSGYENRSLTAEVTVTLQPDAWVPQDGQPMTATVTLTTLAGADGRLSGDYTGTFGNEPAKGHSLGGKLLGPPLPPPSDDNIFMQLNPYGGDEPADRPHYAASVRVRNGRIASVSIGPSFRYGAPQTWRLTDLADASAGDVLKVTGKAPAAFLFTGAPEDLVATVTIDAMRVGEGPGNVGGIFLIEVAGDPGHRVQGSIWGMGEPLKAPPAEDSPGLWQDTDDLRPWFTAVAGFVPPAAGEHPRLLFRKADLPAIRTRAGTPEGQAILKRLRFLLGNDGEAMPADYNHNAPVNSGAKGPDQLPAGAFTMGHCAGFGLLYAVTGDRKYADLSRQCVEKLWAGVPDRDERYAWRKNEGAIMRISPVMECVALAYDLCYDGWDEAFRTQVMRAFLDYDEPLGSPEKNPSWTIDELIFNTSYPPGSNHYGSYFSGAGIAALAILGDPGCDDAKVKRWLDGIHVDIIRNLRFGFGDYGAFAEGHHPGRLSANSGFTSLLKCMRVAYGRDYLAPRPNAAGITLRWIHELYRAGEGTAFLHRGTYGDDGYDRGGVSHGGDICQGFGAILPEQVPALLWTYRTIIEPGEERDHGKWFPAGSGPSFDAVVYPYRAVYAFVNWPIGVEPINPAEVLPLCVVDTVHGYIMARNRWQDDKDLLVSAALCKGGRGYYSFYEKTPRFRIHGPGWTTDLPADFFGTVPRCFAKEADGSFVLSTPGKGGTDGYLCDFSRTSGADAVVALSAAAENQKLKMDKYDGKPGLAAHLLPVGGRQWLVLTIVDGDTAQPAVTVDGEKITIGGMTLTWDGERIVRQ